MSAKADQIVKKINAVQLEIQDLERMAKEADFKPARMAALCAISERHLQRIFKKYLRCTPSHWLRDLQCRLARELIAQGYSSKAAAAELKFATDAHFCREFKKIFGTSPQSFAPNHLACLSMAALGLDKPEETEQELAAGARQPFATAESTGRNDRQAV